MAAHRINFHQKAFMKPYISYIFILLIPLLIINRKHKALFVLVMASVLYSDFAIRFAGFSRLTMGQYISLLMLPFLLPFFRHSIMKKGFSLIRAFSIEFLLLLLLAFYFNNISPFELGMDHERPFGRDLFGRSILGSIRIFADLACIVFILFLFKTRKINFEFFIKVIFILTAFQLAFALIDFSTGFALKKMLFTKVKILSRPTGLCYEPKSMGRLTFGAFLIIFSLFLGKDKYFNVSLKVLLTFLAVIIFAQSLSTFVAGLLTVIVTILLFTSVKNIGRIIGISIVMGLAILVAINTPNFKMLQEKAEWVLHLVEVDRARNEPTLFVYLNHADRNVANLLYFNPKYLYFGCGPNLAPIPASEYTSKYLESWAGTDMSDEVPNTFIYYLSRSGFLGIFIFLNCFFQLRKKIRKFNYKPFAYLLVSTFVFTAINNQLWFYINMAVIYGVLFYQSDTLIENVNTLRSPNKNEPIVPSI